jgi:hypothetical protein
VLPARSSPWHSMFFGGAAKDRVEGAALNAALPSTTEDAVEGKSRHLAPKSSAYTASAVSGIQTGDDRAL